MFHPRMETRIDGISLLSDMRCKAWPGLVTDLTEVVCGREATGEYISRAPRLFVLLETEATTAIDLMCAPDETPQATLSIESPLCFVPAGMQVWSRLTGGGRMKHLDIHFDLDALSEHFPDQIPAVWNTPRLTFSNSYLLALARRFARESARPQAAHPAHEQSLVAALLAAMGNEAPRGGRSGRLTAHQLERVTRFIEENRTRNIRLEEMADEAGLSSAHFSRAFKASTGLPPHRFQLRRRVEWAKTMLAEGGTSLTEIAIDAGFADQAHLTRVFQRFTGATPAAWQRARRQ